MSHKQFAERLNKELDNIDLPSLNSERVKAFAKLLKIHGSTAEDILNGKILPDEKTINLLAEEFEVNPQWLIGKSDQKHKKQDDN